MLYVTKVVVSRRQQFRSSDSLENQRKSPTCQSWPFADRDYVEQHAPTKSGQVGQESPFGMVQHLADRICIRMSLLLGGPAGGAHRWAAERLQHDNFLSPTTRA